MVSLSYLPASVANLIATLEPVLTAFMAYLILSERLTVPQVLGSGLVIGGVILLRMSESRNGKS
jgi:drug/metabolite transporter (DMT)-like permease